MVLAWLAIIQPIVVSPKGLLLGGTFAGLGRPLRLRPQEGHVLITEAHQTCLHVLFIDLAPRASGKSPAVRSLKVAEFDDNDRGVGISLEVAGLSDHGIHQRRR